MTKLSELAGATRLRGAVCITDVNGTTHRYETESSAFDAWKDRVHLLEHRRGAFFETAPPAPVQVSFDFTESVDPVRDRTLMTEHPADEGRRRRKKR